MKDFKKNLNKHIKENLGFYFTTIIFITLGIIIGIFYIKHIGNNDKNNIANYLSNFSKKIIKMDVTNKEIFIKTIKNNLFFMISLYFLGFTIIGVPFILIIDLIKGFMLGFSISSIIHTLGYRGILICILGIMPQNIIYLISFVFLSSISMIFSMGIIKDKINKRWTTNIKNKIMSYSIISVCSFLVYFIGGIVEAYISPGIIKIII